MDQTPDVAVLLAPSLGKLHVDRPGAAIAVLRQPLIAAMLQEISRRVEVLTDFLNLTRVRLLSGGVACRDKIKIW